MEGNPHRGFQVTDHIRRREEATATTTAAAVNEMRRSRDASVHQLQRSKVDLLDLLQSEDTWYLDIVSHLFIPKWYLEEAVVAEWLRRWT